MNEDEGGHSRAAMGTTTKTPLFTFAVVSDTHIGPQDGVSPSPWTSNRLANNRARAVVSRVNALKPDFVIHLGDMIHPTPEQPAYADAAARFRAIFADLEAPLHLVPGNHDIGDKPLVWTPAKCVTDASVERYIDIFGADHGSFGHGPAHFILINSQIINAGSAREAEQWAWLEAELAAHRGKRFFVFGHQPLRLTRNDEAEHYDNSGEPGRGRLLALLQEHKVECWMSGHVHTFFLDREGETDLYVLPAVSALRLDYSELFKSPPPEDDEFGRNDRAKLGFVLVEVFEDGHALHHIRSNGETMAEGAAAPADPLPPRLHPRRGGLLPIGVELRDPWAAPIEIPYSGVVDAFGRKPVRDDYRLLGLIELGLHRLRVPIEDVLAADTLARMRTLAAHGFTFTTFTFGLPDARVTAALREAAGVVEQVNVILPRDELAASRNALQELRAATGLRVFLSLLRSSADHGPAADGRFAHMIDQGFAATDMGLLDEIGLGPGAAPFVDGVVFETVRGESATAGLDTLLEGCEERGLSFSLTVKLGGANPALLSGSRTETTALALSALEAAACLPVGSEVILDTLSDIDRGYFPRFGLIDRRMNPTQTSGSFLRRHAELAANGG